MSARSSRSAPTKLRLGRAESVLRRAADIPSYRATNEETQHARESDTMTTHKPAFKQIASGLRFPEGPVAMPDGSVILVEIERRTLSRVTPDGKIHAIAALGGGILFFHIHSCVYLFMFSLMYLSYSTMNYGSWHIILYSLFTHHVYSF